MESLPHDHRRAVRRGLGHGRVRGHADRQRAGRAARTLPPRIGRHVADPGRVVCRADAGCGRFRLSGRSLRTTTQLPRQPGAVWRHHAGGGLRPEPCRAADPAAARRHRRGGGVFRDQRRHRGTGAEPRTRPRVGLGAELLAARQPGCGTAVLACAVDAAARSGLARRVRLWWPDRAVVRLAAAASAGKPALAGNRRTRA